jgi:hypothetical protein
MFFRLAVWVTDVMASPESDCAGLFLRGMGLMLRACASALSGWLCSREVRYRGARKRRGACLHTLPDRHLGEPYENAIDTPPVGGVASKRRPVLQSSKVLRRTAAEATRNGLLLGYGSGAMNGGLEGSAVARTSYGEAGKETEAFV